MTSNTNKLTRVTAGLALVFAVGLFFLPYFWPEVAQSSIEAAIRVYGDIAMFGLGATGAGTVGYSARNWGAKVKPASAFMDIDGEPL